MELRRRRHRQPINSTGEQSGVRGLALVEGGKVPSLHEHGTGVLLSPLTFRTQLPWQKQATAKECITNHTEMCTWSLLGLFPESLTINVQRRKRNTCSCSFCVCVVVGQTESRWRIVSGKAAVNHVLIPDYLMSFLLEDEMQTRRK